METHERASAQTFLSRFPATAQVPQVPDILTQATPWHRGPLPKSLDPELTAQWLHALGEDNPAVLQRRLDWEGIENGTRRSFDPPFIGRECEWPRALDILRTALKDCVDRPLEDVDSEHLTFPQRPFVDLLRPAVDRALYEVRRELEPRLQFRVMPEAWEQLAASLLDRICEVAAPTLYHCFSRERGAGLTFLAFLGGADRNSQEAYERFICRHRGDGLDTIFSEFPVLARLLGTVVALWMDGSSEMLLRIDGDRPELSRQDTWGISSTAPLASVRQGLSDPHRGGRAVSILGFDCGECQKFLVYKPKDMGVDFVYQELLRDLNQHSALPPLRALQITMRSGYGYMEYVPHRTCEETAELSRFYRNAGRVTAVLYVLGCTDCHYENLIATGDQLVLIDTETLLEADVRDHLKAAASNIEDSLVSATGLRQAIASSVLRSGLLPMWVFVGPNRLAEDISALGVATPMVPTRARTGWLGLNTDYLRSGRVDGPVEQPTSLPVGIGQSNPFADHLDEFLQGFCEQALVLIERRSAWLGESGLLSRFAGLSRRVLMRNTHVYCGLQEQQLHPSALTSSEVQGLVLEQLARTFLLAKNRPHHWPVFAAELYQMEQLDIPFFEHPIDAEGLPLLPGMQPVDRFMVSSGLEACRKRLQALDLDGIAFQCRLIKGSVQTRGTTAHSAAGNSPSSFAAPPNVAETPARQPSADVRRTRAEQLAHQLKDLAIIGSDGTADWLGMDLGSDADKLCYGAVGLSLYAGSTGVAILQAAIAGSGGSADCATHGTLRPLMALASSGNHALLRHWWRGQPLGLGGSGGILLALLELDRLGAPPPAGWCSHRDLALSLLSGLNETILRTDPNLDVLGGVAGLIGPLLRLADDQAAKFAALAGDYLLGRQLDIGGWPQPKSTLASGSDLPLTGFSHGTAGVAAALAALHRHSQDSRLLSGVKRAIAYERRCFDTSRGNWSQSPPSSSNPTFMLAWCHGAPGIALSRICLAGTALEDDSMAGELEAALHTTTRAALEQDHLCCGTMGIVAILRLATRQLHNQEWQQAANRIESLALARADDNGGHFRVFGTREGNMILPGAMTGLSGIGLVLLHSTLADACVAQVMSAGLLPNESVDAGSREQ